MVKQREGYKFVILEPAKSRIERNECPACGKPKEQWIRRKDWRCCSTKCTTKYMIMYVYVGWGHLRDKALKRDNYTCAICKKRPNKREYLEKVCFLEYRKKTIEIHKKKHKILEIGKDYLILDTYDDSQLIGDHIVPIALGGDEWDINNVQTLCIDCNKVKTKKDAGKIAELRSIEKKQLKNQTLI